MTFDVRFWDRVDIQPFGRCWPWKGRLHANGYAYYNPATISVGAYRYAYEQLIGPIPVGLDAEHRCHTEDLTCGGGPTCPHRTCCNPAHIEPVTHRENLLRGRSFIASRAIQDACVHGHPFDAVNTYIRPDTRTRQCRTCRRAAKDRFELRRKETQNV